MTNHIESELRRLLRESNIQIEEVENGERYLTYYDRYMICRLQTEYPVIFSTWNIKRSLNIPAGTIAAFINKGWQYWKERLEDEAEEEE